MAQKEAKEKPLEKMTAKELREMALTIESILGVHSMNKPELIEAIKEAKGIVDEGGRKVDTQAIRNAKKQVRVIREKMEASREAGDDRMVKINRRKINRLKKKTRRLASGE